MNFLDRIMKIDVTMGTLGRLQQFKRAIWSLHDQTVAKDISLYVMDGNVNDNRVKDFLNGNKWKFENVVVLSERAVLPEKSWGLWPKIYNHLMRMGASPLVTYWSDDIFPDKDCLQQGVKKFKDATVGAVAFNWRDGENHPYRIYGTEMHKQVMVNFGLFRRSALQKVKFIDENYRFYNADQDLSLKVWYIGMKVLRCPEAKVTHFSGKKANNEYRSGKWYSKDSRYFASKWAYKKVKNRNVDI